MAPWDDKRMRSRKLGEEPPRRFTPRIQWFGWFVGGKGNRMITTTEKPQMA